MRTGDSISKTGEHEQLRIRLKKERCSQHPSRLKYRLINSKAEVDGDVLSYIEVNPCVDIGDN